MKIIVRNADGVVVHIANNASFETGYLVADNVSDFSLNSSNTTVYDAVVPSGFQRGMTYSVFQAMQTMNALFAAGLVLTSSGTPALNGTYSLTDTAQKNVSGIVTGIAAGLGLPGGGTTFQYLDASNQPHTFDQAHFTAFVSAFRNFIYACDIALATIQNGGTATFPSNQVLIA